MIGRSLLLTGLTLCHVSACTLPPNQTTPDARAEAAAPTHALVEAGEAAEQVGDGVRAEQYYAEALEAGGERRLLTARLIGVCVAGGRLRSALRYAEAALVDAPADARLRGAVYLALGERGRAEAELREALRLQQDAPLAHYSLAVLLSRETTRAAEALPHYRRYVELAPDGRHAPEALHALAVSQ
jgi:tetratricopeptide (TPR) repeat protein